VLNRIDVENDPVNWMDPWGLKSTGNPFWDAGRGLSGAAQDTFGIGDKTSTFSSAADSVVDIAVNGPIEAQALMAHVAYVPVGLAAAAGMANAGSIAPNIPAIGDIIGGIMPHATPEGYGMYSGAAKGAIDLLLDMWDDWQDNPCP
jgi:hypothetical protein